VGKRPSIARIAGTIGLLLVAFLAVRIWWVTPIRDLAVADARWLPAASLPVDEPSDTALRRSLIAEANPLLRITLTGSSGWVDEIRDKELHPYAIIARCDQPDLQLFALGPYVGAASLAIERHASRDRPALPATIGYSLYLPQRGRYISQKDPNAASVPYDLAVERLPLCIRLAGGAMTGAYGESNLVRLTAGGH
jgi:hypothetical protein